MGQEISCNPSPRPRNGGEDEVRKKKEMKNLEEIHITQLMCPSVYRPASRNTLLPLSISCVLLLLYPSGESINKTNEPETQTHIHIRT